jgi:hypothetical protein
MFFMRKTSAIDPTSQNRSASDPDTLRAGNCFQISRIQPPVLAAKDAAVHSHRTARAIKIRSRFRTHATRPLAFHPGSRRMNLIHLEVSAFFEN